MSFVVPNVPFRTTTPVVRFDSRELGLGRFTFLLRVTDNDGNVSTNAEQAVVGIERGPDPVAVLRAPPVVLKGAEFTLYGTESLGANDTPVAVYDWSVSPLAGRPQTARTETPFIRVGNPVPGTTSPLSSLADVGTYEIGLAIRDARGNVSPRHLVTLEIVPEIEQPGRPVAALAILVNGQTTEVAQAGDEVLLDGRGSTSTDRTVPIASFLWLSRPADPAAASAELWEQKQTREPVFPLDRNLRPGVHRVRLVAIDARRRESAPVDAVLLIRG